MEFPENFKETETLEELEKAIEVYSKSKYKNISKINEWKRVIKSINEEIEILETVIDQDQKTIDWYTARKERILQNDER